MNYKKILIFCLFYGIKWAYGIVIPSITYSSLPSVYITKNNVPYTTGGEFVNGIIEITSSANPQSPASPIYLFKCTNSSNQSVIQNSNVFDELKAGNYTISVIDANNQSNFLSTTVTIGNINISELRTPSTCGTKSGSLILTPDAGNSIQFEYGLQPIYPYQISVAQSSISAITTTFNDLDQGDYQLSISFNGGQKRIRKIFSINNLNEITSSKISNDCHTINQNSSVKITVESITVLGVGTIVLPNSNYQINFDNTSYSILNVQTFTRTNRTIPIKIKNINTNCEYETYFGTWLTWEPNTFGSSTLLLDLEKDFNADPLNINNTCGALTAAAEFINKNSGNCELNIPFGIYKIDPQNILSYFKPTPKNGYVFELKNCQNVTIQGVTNTNQQRPIFKFENGFKIGYFTDKTYNVISDLPNNVNALFSSPNTLFNFIDVDHIAISNIILDGNIGKSLIGGYRFTYLVGLYPQKAYECSHIGLRIEKNSKNIEFINIESNHFGTDGITILRTVGSAATGDYFPSDIRLYDSKFLYNGRQGFSWTGGHDIIVDNCDFSNNGYPDPNISNVFMQDGPSFGVDIEPDSKQNTELQCYNGKFSNCRFLNNYGLGLDIIYQAENRVIEHVKFDKCTFMDMDGIAARSRGKYVEFTNSNFYGNFVGGYTSLTTFNNDQDFDETRFIGCTFEDADLSGMGLSLATAYNQPALLLSESRAVTLENCHFLINGPQRTFVNFDMASSSDKNKFSIIKDCTFEFKSNSLSNIGRLNNVIFRGNNSFINTYNSNRRDIEGYGQIFEGSNDCSTPSNFNLDRNFYWTSNKTTVLTEDLVFGDNGNNLDHDGYFIFNNTGKFLIDNNSTVIIGRNSRINNYEYSSMNFGNASGANSNLNHIKLGGKLFVGDPNNTITSANGNVPFNNSDITKTNQQAEILVAANSPMNVNYYGPSFSTAVCICRLPIFSTF